LLNINRHKSQNSASMPAAESILQAARNGARRSLSDALKGLEVALSLMKSRRGGREEAGRGDAATTETRRHESLRKEADRT
jgi:hypothetical protein